MLHAPPAIYRGLGAQATVNYPAVPGYTSTQIAQMVTAAAQAQGVPPALALSVVAHESAFNNNATYYNDPASGGNGTYDYGVMALNQTTVQTLGVSNPYDPQQNINAGVGLLANLMAKYNGDEDLVLQSYATGNTNGTPSSAVQSFINWVTQPNSAKSSILSSVGVDPNGPLFTSDGSAVADSSDGSSTIDLSAFGLPSISLPALPDLTQSTIVDGIPDCAVYGGIALLGGVLLVSVANRAWLVSFSRLRCFVLPFRRI
jgi:hypothetical protein